MSKISENYEKIIKLWKNSPALYKIQISNTRFQKNSNTTHRFQKDFKNNISKKFYGAFKYYTQISNYEAFKCKISKWFQNKDFKKLWSFQILHTDFKKLWSFQIQDFKKIIKLSNTTHRFQKDFKTKISNTTKISKNSKFKLVL